MKTIRDFIKDETGFNGAEKALLVCVGLAIVLAVGKAIYDGSSKAGDDAKRFLEANPLRG